MAKMKFEGVDDLMAKLSAISNSTSRIAPKALFIGAKVVADATKEAIKALPEEKREWGTKEQPLDGVREHERKALEKGLGIARIENKDGVFDTRVGFAGYAPGPNHKQVPVPMIARTVESGTSFMRPQGFVRKTYRRIKTETEEAMGNTINAEIKAIDERMK